MGRCDYYEISRSQEADERKFCKDNSGTQGYRDAGCDKCDGFKTKKECRMFYSSGTLEGLLEKDKGRICQIVMATRLCNHCKKPMFNSWAGEWVDGVFIEIHSKCKEDWKTSHLKPNK